MNSKDSPTDIWQPPTKIEELYAANSGHAFSSINRPTAGARTEAELPAGHAAIQLYSLGTPNGQKISILLEELLDLGLPADYDAHFIDIGKGEQFTSGFTAVNPNGKIPACLDRKGPGGRTIRLFESGSMCLYFAQKFAAFIPEDAALKAEMMNWIFWQMGSQGPMTGQFGHFFVYAPANQLQTRDYGTSRYGMEVQRLCDVLDKALADRDFLLGEAYSLADIMIYPWFAQVMNGYIHTSGVRAAEFLSVDRYTHAQRWAHSIGQRPAVQRGMQVCSWSLREKGTKPWLKD